MRWLWPLLLCACAEEIPQPRVYTGEDFAWVHYTGHDIPDTITCRTILNSLVSCR